MNNSYPSILVVEDSDEDFEATTRSFQKSGVTNTVFRCVDGDDALDFLFRRGAYTDPDTAPRPGIILLDLNLPGTDGRQVLAEIKNDEGLKNIPVIVLTTSAHDDDVLVCYRDGANSYIQKPVDLNAFINAVNGFKSFWLDLAVLPSGA